MSPVAWNYDRQTPAYSVSALDLAQVSGRESLPQTPTLTYARRTGLVAIKPSGPSWLLASLGNMLEPDAIQANVAYRLMSEFSTIEDDVLWNEDSIPFERF
jgi:hypothetical protein